MADYLTTRTGESDWFRVSPRARPHESVTVDGRDGPVECNRFGMDSDDGRSDADINYPETAESEVRYDELGGVLRPLSELRCYVCDQVMSEGRGVLDDRVHRIGIAQAGTNAGSWIWGPVAVHIGCLEDLSIPIDDVVVSDYETRIDTVPYDWALQTCTKRSR